MRKIVTDALDLLGLLLLVAAAAVLVWPFTAAGALAVGGLGLLGGSWAVDRAQRRVGGR
jgi:hypothetical protein